MRFKVDGMTCDHCVRAVQGAVQAAAPGATSSIDLATGLLSVSGTPDPARIVQSIEAEGYEAHLLPG